MPQEHAAGLRDSAARAFPQTQEVQVSFSAGFPGESRRLRWMGAMAAVMLAGACGGCSIAMPASQGDQAMALWRGDPADVTSAIPHKPSKSLSRSLTAEDWRRASAALSTALDPQGDGGAVDWNNPQSHARGSFTPMGQAYPLEGKICRAFRADVSAGGKRQDIRGAACRDKTADWALTEVAANDKG